MKTSIHSVEALLITKLQELSYEDKNLIHNGETPTIFKFTAKNFDSD